MKQKIVIKVSMNRPKSRKKALKIAVGCSGVESAALSEKDESIIEVVGDGVDAVKLTTKLKKKFEKRICLSPFTTTGFVELISVSPVTKKDEEKEKDKETKVQPWVCQSGYSVPLFYVIRDYDPCTCSIM